MPPVLVLGCVAALALTASSPAATTGSEKRKEADRVFERGGAAEKASPPARERDDAGDRNRKVICTMRIMRADPSIDRAMVVAIEKPVDSGMVVPTGCAAE